MSAKYFQSSARSALGLIRQGNEDSAFISAQLIAVADGMGGHAAGEVASKIAVKVLHSLVPTLTAQEIDQDSVEDLLMHSLHSIDYEIAAITEEDTDKRGMGTTLTALLIRDEQIALLHVGDSRCYRLRSNTIEQLSVDHSVVQELLDQGAITAKEAVDHPQRSMLTQALRGDGTTTPVLQIYEVKKGDRYLLCSDGLSGVLTEKEIKAGLAKSDKNEAVKFLVDATLENGAPDNVSVVIADIVEATDGKTEFFGAASDK
jgi:serine/threonine protein phosphatase PrpC